MAENVGWSYKVSGLDGMIRAMEQISAPPSVDTTKPLNKVALEAFEVTQTDVHVITGKLRESGRLKVSTKGYVWNMTIAYGGKVSSPVGKHEDPAYYAVFEMGRKGVKPGYGPHDFFYNVEPIVDSGIEDAIDAHMAPLKGTL